MLTPRAVSVWGNPELNPPLLDPLIDHGSPMLMLERGTSAFPHTALTVSVDQLPTLS